MENKEKPQYEAPELTEVDSKLLFKGELGGTVSQPIIPEDPEV